MNQLPLKVRPTPNHRRAVLAQSGSPNFCPIWIEVKDSQLIIDEDGIDDHFAPPASKRKPGVKLPGNNIKIWLDIAVLNPSMQTELARKAGHGLAIGQLLPPLCLQSPTCLTPSPQLLPPTRSTAEAPSPCIAATKGSQTPTPSATD